MRVDSNLAELSRLPGSFIISKLNDGPTVFLIMFALD